MTTPTDPTLPLTVPPETAPETATEAERQERSDRIYAQYSSAMRFFGEVPAPQVPIAKT